MTWQDEFLDYQEALDDTRRNEERRQVATQHYRAGFAANEQRTHRVLADALAPAMQEAFRRATEELAHARVDQAVRRLVERHVSTQSVSVKLPLLATDDIEVNFRRVLIELPSQCIAVALRA